MLFTAIKFIVDKLYKVYFELHYLYRKDTVI